MNVCSSMFNAIKATILVLVYFVTKAKSDKICYRVNLEPTGRLLQHPVAPPKEQYRMGKISYHVFDGSGNVLMASNASASRVCIDDSVSCHFWFVHGNGFFDIIVRDDENDNNDDDNNEDEEELIETGEVYFHEPKLLQMGHCQHHCRDDHQQLTFIGLMNDEPKLYDSNNNEVIHTLFSARKMLEDDSNNKNYKREDKGAIMKTACIHPSGCYKLVGSSLYIVSDNNKNNKKQEQGSTFLDAEIVGDKSKCHSHCDYKPLLSSTQRGREILKVATSISDSDALIDVQSPQYKAACWLINDDALALNADDENIVQRYVLALFFYAVRGDEWDRGVDFLTPKHECNWRKWVFRFSYLYSSYNFDDENAGDGVHCNELGYVIGIDLSWNNLAGTIPFELASLVNIKFMKLIVNSLSGTIPSALGALQQLQSIDLIYNILTGTIPESLGNMATLLGLGLNNNMLTGTIPFFGQKTFDNFDVEGNMMTGSIPDEIWKWTNLVALRVSGNNFGGTIPEDIGNMTLLMNLKMGSTGLSGTLPSKLLKLPNLFYLVLSGNSLTGTIPNQVAIDSKLSWMYLQQNRLTGAIPSELSLLENLWQLHLDNNALSGEIPPNLTNIPRLSGLHLDHNNLSGDVPFHDCGLSPRSMEADCDTPAKVSCQCCTDCHGIFRYQDDELVCTSGELTLIFENLDPGAYFGFELLTSEGERLHFQFSRVMDLNSTYVHTLCVPISGCFVLNIYNEFVQNSLGMKVLLNNNLVLEKVLEVTEVSFVNDTSTYHWFTFGYHSSGTMKQDSCSDFLLCDAKIEANSTLRELVNKLTRVTGIQAFNDTLSPHHKAGCGWISYLKGHENENYKYTKLLQWFYLGVLFYETNGKEWTNSSMWVTNTTVCNWYGIKCDNFGIVTSIRLRSNNLRGTLPTEIAELRGLQYVLLDGNYLSGSLPLHIGAKMTPLEEFNISRNGLWGSIPSEFSKLRKLKKFDASHNQLTGSLPDDVGNWKELQVFNIFNNTCAGSLPTTFYDLQSLKQLSLGSNLFAGPVRRLYQLFNLESLDLSQNFFTGNLPLDTSQKRMRVLQLSGNLFRGSIPISVGELKLLEVLFLHSNLLTGNLPSEMGNLQNLVRVSFSDNSIKGIVPKEIGNLKNLTLLHLQNNQLGGSGDIFDYAISDYISDCGNTFIGSARVECRSCSSCCNVNGDCISNDITWPGRAIPVTRISPQALVFLTILAASALFLICAFIYRSVRNESPDCDFCDGFQVHSVYRFFITNSIGANVFAAAILTVQVVLLYIFLEAADFTADKNDWKYSMSCPDNSILCEDSRLITLMAWFAYSCIMFCYLANDLVEGAKMIYQSALPGSGRKGAFAGFVVLYVTICSAVVSGLYTHSTGISNTDILKDAVVLLFLNELDERLYVVLKAVRPLWVEELDKECKEHFNKLTRRQSTNTHRKVVVEDLQQLNSGCERSQDSAANHEWSRVEDKTLAKEQDGAIAKIKRQLASLECAHAESRTDHKALEQKYSTLEQDICHFKLHLRREVEQVNNMINLLPS